MGLLSVVQNKVSIQEHESQHSVIADSPKRGTNTYRLPNSALTEVSKGTLLERSAHDVLVRPFVLGGIGSSHSDSSWLCAVK